MPGNTLRPKRRPIWFADREGKPVRIATKVSTVSRHLRGFGRARPHVVREHLRERPSYMKRESVRDENGDRRMVWMDRRSRHRSDIALGNDEFAKDERPDLYSGPVVITVLEQNQQYGGPEEGGSWYDRFEPVKTVFLPATPGVNNPVDVYFALVDLAKQYSNVGRRPVHSAWPESHYKIVVSDRPKMNTPEHRPRYQ